MQKKPETDLDGLTSSCETMLRAIEHALANGYLGMGSTRKMVEDAALELRKALEKLKTPR